MQVDSLIKQMEIEVRGTRDQALKKDLDQRVSNYRAAYTKMKSDHNKAIQDAERNNLLGDNSGLSAKTHTQRQRLLDTNEQLE